MSSTDAFFSAVAGVQGEQDLGPLAWVSAELRKSLAGAAQAVVHFARESEIASEVNFAPCDTALLRQAQQSLHQALGALEMVNQAAPALMVAAMEAAVLRFEQSPKLCTLQAASCLESASFALLEYLETVLARRPVSPVALFPQYRDVQALAGNDKVHPADLWPVERLMREPQLPGNICALPYGPQARALLDAAVLGMVKSGDVAAAAQMRAICLGFAAGQSETGARIFWKIAAGFFDAFAHGLLHTDVYVKRVASRVLLQYAAVCKGDSLLSERLTQDLLFFCAQATEPQSDARVLRAVRETFALERHPRVDYDQPRFGRFDQASQQPPAEAAPVREDEQIKLIDGLRIPLSLYNVYLNEADEWSRSLDQVLQEWAQALEHAQPEAAVHLAHSLAGSSATVGFKELSHLARTLEQALMHIRPQGRGDAQQLTVLQAAADEIRRLLHQFAAGFLKSPQPAVQASLQQLLATEIHRNPGEWDGHEALDAEDAIDPDLCTIFEQEAAELLPLLGMSLRDWLAKPERSEARNASLRALHTLKGSARLAGAMRLGEMAHRLESAIEQVDLPEAAQIEPLLGKFDTLQAHFLALRAMSEDAVAAPAENGARSDVPAGLRPATFTALTPWAAGRAAAQQLVRVRGQLLDRLISQSGEVLIARSRIAARLVQARSSLYDLNGNLERLRQQLRAIEVQAETQMQSRLALSKDSAVGFDPLEFDRFTRVQELTRMMAESVNDVATVQRNLQRDFAAAEDDLVAQGRQARDLQRDLLRTRMVEFDAIAERLYAVVRQAAKETGKQVRLNIIGGTIEMDRGVLDRMAPAFEHLLRNCVAHGVELPAEREALGKPATGTIAVTLQHAGNDVSVRIEDDGAGLDFERIRATAVARGLIAQETVMTSQEATELIFTPGFTTAAEVTGVAGRGIGTDVVRAEVQALGGRIETQSTPGAGASFSLVLPLTTAVTQVVMLRMGKLAVGVPANLVEIVRRVPVETLDQAYRSGSLQDAGSDEALPFFWGGALWQSSTLSLEGVGKTRAVVIFRSASQRLALHVDEVLGNQELVVKPLGPQLARLPGLTGMSVLASGAVVLIYNPVALATVYGEQVRAAVAVMPKGGDMAAAQAVGEVPLVLVVDDSITVRRVTQRLLQREGYRVEVAADGLQALERLRSERPLVLLSDIEMPRMDGFDLAQQIRSDQRLHDLPIIMITSRIAQKHREHARELGVNHYLGKPYSDEELLSLVRHYAALAAQAA